jgi:hypothetical protein
MDSLTRPGWLKCGIFALATFAGLTASVEAKPLSSLFKDINPHHRAGHPEFVRPYHAYPTDAPPYCFGWVGGGAPTGIGDARTLEEGTWGMDYCGHLVRHRVWLNWFHGRRAQGGEGRYETDGPKLVKPK